MVRTRLSLVAPTPLPPAFAELLEAALGAGDVASLLFVPAGRAEAAAIAAIAAKYAVASIAVGTEAFPELDGVHIETGPADVAAARRTLGQNMIVGAGGIRSRHDAMTLGELLPDYVFFGRLGGEGEAVANADTFDLAAWWAALFEIPAMLMGGRQIADAAAAQAAGIEFIALASAVWDHPAGPGAAVTEANALLDASVTA